MITRRNKLKGVPYMKKEKGYKYFRLYQLKKGCLLSLVIQTS